ncbi:MAG: CDP-diacylglycerol--glycerol-3-phosphate 3-phosphatidyltransferase, partial [Clostridia bacterium]|nr:CDP-diacylglycerol--glycerol-3-phosphate 3-phosphatidyltransferase [Clostridia bacterium]
MSSDTKKDKDKKETEVIDKDSKKYRFYSGNGGMNVPNRLTIVRVIMIPIFILFYFVPFKGHYFVALAVFILSTLTDMADGKIARKYDLISDFGKLLDPIADKVLVLSAFVCFISDVNVFYDSNFGSWGIIVAGICVVLIIAREIMVAGIRLVAADKGIAIAADWFGKVKTVTQYISIFVLLFGTGFINVSTGSGAVYRIGEYFNYLGFAVLVLAMIFTVISGVNYVIKNLDVFKAPEKRHGQAAAAAAAPAGAPAGEPVKPYMRPALSLLASVPADSAVDASLKGVMEGPKMANVKPGTLTAALGVTAEGDPICPNLSNLQHILIAGCPDTGATEAVNSMITSLIYRLGPKELKLLLISAGTHSLDEYKGLPHVHGSIISAPEDAIGELSLLSQEEDRRIALFKDLPDKKNIEEYNKTCFPGSGKERLAHIIVVVSDLSVLMKASASLTESAIMTVLQAARACGIHFVICSSDASAEGMPAALKASISTRIAFRLPTEEASCYIIDRPGAESLAPGQMLYKGNSVADPVPL